MTLRRISSAAHSPSVDGLPRLVASISTGSDPSESAILVLTSSRDSVKSIPPQRQKRPTTRHKHLTSPSPSSPPNNNNNQPTNQPTLPSDHRSSTRYSPISCPSPKGIPASRCPRLLTLVSKRRTLYKGLPYNLPFFGFHLFDSGSTTPSQCQRSSSPLRSWPRIWEISTMNVDG